MSVRYSYLQQQFSDPEEIFNEIRKLIKTGEFTLGPQVQEFERRFANLIGTKHAIGVASGTDALKLPLRALGIGHGDEVLTCANTFIATAGAINEVGARPVFVDCTDHYVMDVDKIEAAITDRTKAIMPVHFTGQPVDMEKLMSIAAEYSLHVVEDACQSILCKFNHQNCGTFGIAGGFSLHPLKNLNVWADGGVIVTNDDAMNDKLRLLRNHGLKNRDEIACFGYNSRLDSIQAIVGNWLIDKTEGITYKRRRNAAYYNKGLFDLRDQIRIAPDRPNCEPCYHLYMFRVSPMHRDRLLAFLQQAGIEAKVHYPIPLYRQEGLAHLGYSEGDFPMADRQANEVISLPVDQHLEIEQQDFVIKKIKEYFAEAAKW